MMILTLISLTGHVQHPDDGVGVGPVGARRHQSLVPVVVGHRADGEGRLHVKVQLVPLLDQVVVVGGSIPPRALHFCVYSTATRRQLANDDASVSVIHQGL